MQESSCCLYSVQEIRPCGCGSLGRLRLVWIALGAVVALAIHANADALPGGSDDPQLAELARRVSELVGKATDSNSEGVATNTAMRAQGAAVQQLAATTKGDVEIRLRPGNQTLMQLRGRSLRAPAAGAALLAVATSHEQIAREFFKPTVSSCG